MRRFASTLQSPAGKDAVAVLKEMFSDEVFAYGGSDIGKAIKLLMEMSSMDKAVAGGSRGRRRPEGSQDETVFRTSSRTNWTTFRCRRS